MYQMSDIDVGIRMSLQTQKFGGTSKGGWLQALPQFDAKIWPVQLLD